ncbi:HU family DNA-binding protein [Tabrizicola caldifontis]|uniref:HU family DNA-binding protein n=1 Tax=Tabrizicola caldifontis TaxID=2528036 RepID=UPI001080E6FA|nr:HU family DNA-binding protein [Rhodobacter sp. YIM 73028]
MAPRTSKTPETKPAKSSAKARSAGKPTANSPAAAKPAKPALTVAEKAASAEGKVGTLRLKDLVDRAAAATGGKKPQVKKTVEATLAAMASALASGHTLVLPPLGKLRVAKSTGGAMTLKLRVPTGKVPAGKPLADDGEDE